jgi:hypothetical protein
MPDLKWSPAEKKIARAAYEAALESALTAILSELKAKAYAAVTPSDMWDIEVFAPPTPPDRRDIRVSLLAASIRLRAACSRGTFGHDAAQRLGGREIGD